MSDYVCLIYTLQIILFIIDENKADKVIDVRLCLLNIYPSNHYFYKE